MVNMTLAVPRELKEQMEEHPEINWSEVARQAFRQKVEDMAFLENLAAKVDLTEEDTIRLGRKVNAAMREHYYGSAE